MNYPGFVGSDYQSQSPLADQERTVNWYVERMESRGATSQAALYPTPGVQSLSVHVGGGGGRAHFSMAGREFAVIGSLFVEIDAFGVATFRFSVTISSDPATISSNGDGGGQLFVTSGGNGYIYDLTTNIGTQIAALNGKATMGDHLDGYFLALDAPNSTLYMSNLLNGATWNTGVDFAQRSIAPDPWRSMKVSGRYIWLFGEHTSEVWYNTGATFPFAPIPGSGLVPWGIAAPFSVVLANGALTWLGATTRGEAYVLTASGLTPEVVSDYPIQNAISRYGRVTDAVGDSYSDLGHTFYLLSFPSEGITWAWDVGGQWAQRGTWISADHEYTVWRPRWHALAYGEHRMLDAETGNIYRMSSTLGTDVDSRPIRRMRQAPCMNAENERVFYSALELELEPGLGLSTGQGENPQAMLQLSNDGGKTWGSEMWRSAGKIGEYAKRVTWNRLGSARKRVVRVVVSDPIPWRIMRASLQLGQTPQAVARQAQAAR